MKPSIKATAFLCAYSLSALSSAQFADFSGAGDLPFAGDLLQNNFFFFVDNGFVGIPPLADPGKLLGQIAGGASLGQDVLADPLAFLSAGSTGLASSVLPILPLLALDQAGIPDYLLGGGSIFSDSLVFGTGPDGFSLPAAPGLNAPLF